MNDPTKDADMLRLQQHIDQLADHFDSVQIFATRHEAGEKEGTINIQLGAGNWFTRYGQVREWCIRCDEDARVARRPTDL